MTKKMFTTLFLLILVSLSYGSLSNAPTELKVDFTEKIYTISWKPVDGAYGYNVYTAENAGLTKDKKIKINKKLIRSRNKYVYMWHFENGEKVRKVKGYRHYISVTAVFKKDDGTLVESAQSREKHNLYFGKFGNVINGDKIKNVLVQNQRSEKLPVTIKPTTVEKLTQFCNSDGFKYLQSIHKNIDAQKIGGCVPIATVLTKLLIENGIDAYRVDGKLIRQFHSFVIINVEGNEYVFDFSADQFYPGAAPVLMPRDYCSIMNPSSKDGSSQMYQIGKIYNADAIGLANNKRSAVYKKIYLAVKGDE